MRAVHIGLGGNVGDPVATLRDALERIARLPGVELDAVSSAYESAPVGLTDQPAFINAAARLVTGLTLRALLDGLLAVEQELGRVRTVRYGPRTCDLDILLAGHEVADEPGLAVPHPRLAERRFALEPLVEIDPGLSLPDGRLLSALLEAVHDQAVRRLDGVQLRTAFNYDDGHARERPEVSNIDELEEYDAELELRLKKEYADVYGLFRYCVLTQEATYLCNQLDLKIEHQPSYPMIHVAMEDVWVWDKNRPTRIIPRTDIHTTQDVTIEELRPPESTPPLAPPTL